MIEPVAKMTVEFAPPSAVAAARRRTLPRKVASDWTGASSAGGLGKVGAFIAGVQKWLNDPWAKLLLVPSASRKQGASAPGSTTPMAVTRTPAFVAAASKLPLSCGGTVQRIS